MKLPLLLLLLAISPAQAASIQKWVDQDGVVHYGDSPPLRAQTERILVTRPPSNPGKPLPRLNSNGSTDRENTRSSAGKAEPPQRFNAQKDAVRICERARKDLQIIQRNTRIKLRQPDGSVRYMTKEEIQQRREKSQKLIDTYCK